MPILLQAGAEQTVVLDPEQLNLLLESQVAATQGIQLYVGFVILMLSGLCMMIAVFGGR